MAKLRSWLWLISANTVVAVVACAQAQPDRTIGEALRSLASRADRILVGQVIAIHRDRGAVEITFRVDQTLQGGATPQFTLREWAGLWPPGTHRYVVGQRMMLFLHAPSAAGFSSAVDGMEGMVPVIPTGPGSDPLLDVRRLFTRMLRAQDAALPSAASSAIALSEAATVVQRWREPTWQEPILRALPAAVAPHGAPPIEALPVRRTFPIEMQPAEVSGARNVR